MPGGLATQAYLPEKEVIMGGRRYDRGPFVGWRKNVMPTLPEEERLFSTTMNRETVWVIEDGAAFTLMYPLDY